ncbi:glycosyltransferase family 2 protein [Nubsella zeaxanthinifaciens]|uniref:glycosyltransferase family 2 protein n=1 Tax=Nubsella zeaxanthinifaciens TaxID=392412 RepID=UPI003D0680D9
MIPKISVIICVFNEEFCLIDALRSIKNNDIYEEVEVIIINDCSYNPLTKRILGLLKRFNYKVFDSPFNLGLSNSRNLGFQNSKSEYIVPLDADDILPTGSLDKIHRTFRENPDADFVYGNYVINIENSQDIIYMNEITENGLCNLKLLLNNWILLGTSPCKKSLWTRAGGYSQKYANSCQDLDFWIRAFKAKANGVFLNETIYQWNRNNSGMNETFDRTDYYLMLKEHHLFLSMFQNKKQLVNTISEGFYKHKKLKNLVFFNLKNLMLLNYKNILRPMLLVWSNLKK